MVGRNLKRNEVVFGIAIAASILLCLQVWAQELKPYKMNPFYWQYKDKPVLLLGAFNGAHNVFLEPDITDPPGNLTLLMDKMVSAGGNVIRCVFDAGNAILQGYPASHQKRGNRYDLNLFTSGRGSFWSKFNTMLSEADARDIIVQIEVWDRFDWQQDSWLNSPFRPANNINYTTSQSGLADSYESYKDNPFSRGVPGYPDYNSASSSREAQYDLVRSFQTKYIEHMLSISLKYENILYTINNETHTHLAWSQYWIELINDIAAAQGKVVYVTDMFDNGWDLQVSDNYTQVFANPNIYKFVDISQNNAMKNTGGPEGHWANILYTRNQISSSIRPINNTKIYGADSFINEAFHLRVFTRYGNLAGQNNFWMNIIGGTASARFHRPSAGQGLSTLSMASIRAARKLETKVKMWELQPRNDLLERRDTFTVSLPEHNFKNEPFIYGEAYLSAKPGEKYALYFTKGGSVDLNTNAFGGVRFDVNWINIDTGDWGPSATISGGRQIPINAPGSGAWVAAIVKSDTQSEQMLSMLTITPISSRISVQFQDAVVTALDQNSQPMPGVSIITSKSGRRVDVRPGMAITEEDGTALFKFRFLPFGGNGKITFIADELSTTIKQRE